MILERRVQSTVPPCYSLALHLGCEGLDRFLFSKTFFTIFTRQRYIKVIMFHFICHKRAVDNRSFHNTYHKVFNASMKGPHPDNEKYQNNVSEHQTSVQFHNHIN